MNGTLDLLALLALVPTSRSHRYAGPSPLGALLNADEVPRRRSLSCPEYDRCLDAAFRRGWRSWSCQGCALQPLGATFRALETMRAGALRPLADFDG